MAETVPEDMALKTERKGGKTETMHRTTLYVSAELAAAVKQIAEARHASVNSVLVEALEALVLAHQDEAEGRAPSSRPEAASIEASLSLRRDVDRLIERVTVLEALHHGRTKIAMPDGERRLLDATGVRREARALIEARGAPIPHRELLHLLQEKYVLPGRNASENLRTILVHPKTKGFTFLNGFGYTTS